MKNRSEKNKEQGQRLRHFLHDKFNLSEDAATQAEVIENIRKGIEFRGTNLWVLIFAILIASVGLNINLVAAITGAMLISPLMGPIMGIGLSIGINDFELLKRSMKNFGFMVLVSILVSTFYFFISPISTAHSELLARTQPTIYDVLIAFFGGLAGIIGQTRKDRANMIIPGVAIATALMPPLCTAGYGLATGQLNFFAGAAYLFLINMVFIAFATILGVRILKFDKKVFLDKQRGKRVKQYMAIFLVVTILPSIVIGLQLIRRSVFESNADRFVSNVVKFDATQVINYSKLYNRNGSEIELVLIGEPVSNDVIDNIRAQLPAYALTHTTVTFRQPAVSEQLDFTTIQQNMEQILNEKNRRIYELEREVYRHAADTLPIHDISREMGAISPKVNQVSLSRNVIFDNRGTTIDTVLMAQIRVGREGLTRQEEEVIRNWLKTRTRSDTIRMYIERGE